jgi:adenylate cyclase
MMGADEEGTHATFKAHRTAIYPIILNHGGRLVKNTGDGFLLEFPSIVGAIQAAIAIQGLMAERNNHIPADRVMQFRLGIHMGDVMADEDEVFGDDVNIAVRLESVAAPGGLAISAGRPGRRRRTRRIWRLSIERRSWECSLSQILATAPTSIFRTD